MKNVVLYVSSIRRGGAERIAIRMAKELGKYYNITLMVNTDMGANGYTYDGDNLLNLDIEKPSKSYYEKIIGNWLRLRKLYKALKLVKADMVICFGTKESIRVAMLRPLMKTKVIAYEQTVITPQRIGLVWYRLFQVFYGLMDKIVIQTKEGFSMLPKRYQKKTVVIGNPIDVPKQGIYDVVLKENKLIAVGRLCDVKGFDYMIEAFSMTAKEHDWLLEIWGEGPVRKKLQSLINKYHLKDRIFLKGITEDPLKTLASGKLFLLTSVNEGFPNALAEAMSVELPCIAVDCPTGPKDLLGDGSGVVVHREIKEAFAVKIVELINDEEKRKTIGEKGYEKISQFKTKIVIKQWWHLLEEL